MRIRDRRSGLLLGTWLAVGVLTVSGCRVGTGISLDLGSILASGGASDSLDATTVAAGLKDALRVGSERTVGATSGLDGFLGNELIRLAIPEELSTMATALRTVGFGPEVDELEVAMNRAAEQASGEALDIFAGQIGRMTVSDAFGILNGGPTAATDYFRANTSTALRQRFAPIVDAKMQAVGLAESYGSLVERYNQLPFVTSPALDLEQYVTDRTLSGLFTVLGQEESKIRENPAARSTELLQRVFAR